MIAVAVPMPAGSPTRPPTSTTPPPITIYSCLTVRLRIHPYALLGPHFASRLKGLPSQRK